jgi:hypothetical protein
MVVDGVLPVSALSGGCSRARGGYSTSWSLSSKVLLVVMVERYGG